MRTHLAAEVIVKLYPVSDLHNEFSVFVPPKIDIDVAILAGDIDVKERGVAWAAQNFTCPVLYIPGNHEYYGGQLVHSLRKLRQAASETPNVIVLDRDEVVIGNVRFLGATGWTDYTATGNAPMAALMAQDALKDFKKIRTEGYKRVLPERFAQEARSSRAWLREKIATPFDGKTVVITHHAPSLESVKLHPESGTHLDSAFGNRWEDLMGEGVDLFVHGHTHACVDYDMYGTRVISNQRGYPGEVTDFDPGLILEI